MQLKTKKKTTLRHSSNLQTSLVMAALQALLNSPSNNQLCDALCMAKSALALQHVQLLYCLQKTNGAGLG